MRLKEWLQTMPRTKNKRNIVQTQACSLTAWRVTDSQSLMEFEYAHHRIMHAVVYGYSIGIADDSDADSSRYGIGQRIQLLLE